MKGIVITPTLEAKCRAVYSNEHSKFISKSMLLVEDLGREFKHQDITYKIIGMWINEDSSIDIIICNEHKAYYKLSHREVSHMMGYFRYRNRVTGIEHPENYSMRRLRLITPEENGA
jgi:hypothetical protein